MSTRLGPKAAASQVVYPDSDGKRMAENTLQFQWIVTIKEGLDALFRDRTDVFVAGDLLWYPIEGDNRMRLAPDAMVVFGRPKGYRGSYKQWEEGGIAPQVVFEVLSPDNRAGEMRKKRKFYERFKVDEYYVYDPDHHTFAAYHRNGEELVAIPNPVGMTSPRLGVRFELEGESFALFGPDGCRFLTNGELAEQRDELAEQRDELARSVEKQRSRADRLADRLRELGIDPDEEP